MAALLRRCVSEDNSEIGRTLMVRSNHRIYRKELRSDWLPSGSTLPLVQGSFVAMKQFCGSPCKQKMKKLCKKEFKILEKCNHANVVTVLELCLEFDESNPESWPSFYMELGECSLHFVLTATRRDSSEFAYPTGENGYSWQHCITWLRQIAGAMAYLHDKQILHRDLKSTNVIMLNHKTVCKVCDFDMSRYYDRDETSSMTLDIGTYRWMAPEVRSGRANIKQRYDLKVDCFSFGVLICEAVFRRKPFDCYEDRIFTKLEIPEMLADVAAETEQAQGAMTLKRDGNTLRADLDKTFAVFRVEKKVWQLIEKLLGWEPEQRPAFNLIVSQLAIVEPAAGEDSEIADRPLPQLTNLEPDVVNGHAPDLLRSDTGLLTNQACPAIPSVQRVARVLYTVELADLGSHQLTVDEEERLLELLNTNADNVAYFSEGDQSLQATDGVAVPQIRIQFRTRGARLELEISGPDHDARTRLASVCRTNADVAKWMADLFDHEVRFRRLRGLNFRIAVEEQS